mgnify:CR=1 FL=1
MKKFITKSFLYFIPFIVFLIFVESFITLKSNSFNLKHKYLKDNIHKLQCAFLGSSYTQNAINPEFISRASINLGYGGQDYQINERLFISKLVNSNIKTIFLELNYNSLIKKNDSDYFRFGWYYYYYNINLNNLSLINKIYLYKSSPKYFNNYILTSFSADKYEYNINRYGFITNDFPGKFLEFKYNDSLIYNHYKKKRGSKKININDTFNKEKINTIINLSNKNNIKIVLIKYPMYSSFRGKFFPHLLKQNKNYIDSLLASNQNISYLNFEKDNRFLTTDFKNESHLNSNGAKKLTLIVNEYLEKN